MKSTVVSFLHLQTSNQLSVIIYKLSESSITDANRRNSHMLRLEIKKETVEKE